MLTGGTYTSGARPAARARAGGPAPSWHHSAGRKAAAPLPGAPRARPGGPDAGPSATSPPRPAQGTVGTAAGARGRPGEAHRRPARRPRSTPQPGPRTASKGREVGNDCSGGKVGAPWVIGEPTFRLATRPGGRLACLPLNRARSAAKERAHPEDDSLTDPGEPYRFGTRNADSDSGSNAGGFPAVHNKRLSPDRLRRSRLSTRTEQALRWAEQT